MTDIPDNIDGIIGGPPCQSWSAAGSKRGEEDPRGQLFFDYIHVIENKQPKFFLAENVGGIFAPRHKDALENILDRLSIAGDIGYNVKYRLLNASDFGVPQDRKRVFIIGFRKDLNIEFDFDNFIEENKVEVKTTLENVIGNLHNIKALEALPKNYANPIDSLNFSNHEYMTGSFSSQYMSRNRVRKWDQQSFTILAGGRHAPIHPQAPVMELVEKDVRRFVPGHEHLYRRLSVRECARIQTFPDDFRFIYQKVADGYKMIGNAVPVHLAYLLGTKIMNMLEIKKEKLSRYK